MKNQKIVISTLISLLSLSTFAHATQSNFVIKNEIYAMSDENVYANVKIVIGNWVGGEIKIPQNSSQTYTLPNDGIPVYLFADVYFRNLPLSNKQHCTFAYEGGKNLTLHISANKNPIDTQTQINCDWQEI